MLKVSWKDMFAGFQYTVFENKLSFMKKAVLHIFTLIEYKARQVLRDLFSTNQENGSEMTFVTIATKTNVKYLKT